MTYEMKPNSGSLFKNDRKESENHPDYTGSALIGGVEYWVSAWVKKPQGKKPYMSFSYKPKDENQAREPQGGKAMDDEIPF